jgi:dTMP kinase
MKIITFEGIEGVGKSTQIQLLNNYLNEKGYKTEILREPGSTTTGEQIREILLNTPIDLSSESELLLMFAARAQLIKEKLLDSDKDIVLFDRFYDASVAYQGYGRGLSLEAIFNLIELTNCPIPNITFLLDIDVEEGFRRKSNDLKDRIESAGNDFFERVRNGYIEISKKNKERVKVLDATMKIEELHNEIINITNKIL